LLLITLLAAAAASSLAAVIPPQSPIDIKGGAVKMLPALTFDYPKADVEVTTTRSAMGTTESIKANIKVTVPPPPQVVATLQVGNDANKYKLKDFHFHIHSEHTLGGLLFPMEMHIVHEREKDGVKENLAVGRWILEGAENAVLKVMFDNLPPVPAQGAPHNPFLINNFMLDGLLPPAGMRSSWRYNGSLTTGLVEMGGQTVSPTPVSWIVFKEPLIMSRDQITKFRNHFPNGNWRETFPHVPGAAGHDLMTDVGIPEPSTAGLLAVAGLVAAGRRRRR
jgi:carbonic anhydrase